MDLFPCMRDHKSSQTARLNQTLTVYESKPKNFLTQMNGAMSAVGQFHETRYDDSGNIGNWYGRAYWIGDALRPPHLAE